MSWIEEFWYAFTATFVAPAELSPAFQGLMLAWLTAVGASIGSFLNVVVYRVPAGLSVVHPGSRCPRCLHAIRGFDNLPIFSWLNLRGRCRDCGLPIAARYPLVESAVAILTAAISVAVLFPLDWLPVDWRPHGRAPLVGYGAWWIWLVDVLFVMTCFAAGLIEWDEHAPPLRLFAPLGLAAIATAFLLEPYGLIPTLGTLVEFGPRPELPENAVKPVAALVGAGLGAFIGRLLPEVEGRGIRRGAYAISLSLAGLLWGPSASFCCAGAVAISLAAWRVTGQPRRSPLPPLLLVALVMTVLLFVARW